MHWYFGRELYTQRRVFLMWQIPFQYTVILTLASGVPTILSNYFYLIHFYIDFIHCYTCARNKKMHFFKKENANANICSRLCIETSRRSWNLEKAWNLRKAMKPPESYVTSRKPWQLLKAMKPPESCWKLSQPIVTFERYNNTWKYWSLWSPNYNKYLVNISECKAYITL